LSGCPRLLLLGLRWLPKRIRGLASPAITSHVIRWYRVRDLAIAVASGAGLAALAYMVMLRDRPESISGFFVENAYTQGGGTNIVNVILVDFRAFDTFGEITVLGIVAITIYALLRRFRPAADSIAVPEQQRAHDGYDEAHPGRQKGDTVKGAMAVPALLMTMLFPVIGVAAVFMLLRGHDLPGGGFVAGVTMAVAFILQYMAHGTALTEARLRVLPMRWMGTGLLVAAVVGSAAWLFGRPFLSTSFLYLDIPWIGAVPLASAFLFDLGVFALVVGATVLMLIAIAHQSVRSHRAPGRAPVAAAKAGVR
jgi:multicomponent K+:H+ antiporter subunit A